MNKEIRIKFVSDTLLETLKSNPRKIQEKIAVSNNAEFLRTFVHGELYQEKKFRIFDFDLKVSPNGNYKDVDLENSITLYENLKHLPRHIVADERFWLWLYFDKFFEVAKQAMPFKSDSTFKDHWLYSQGKRRGVFFGVLSRCFFRVLLTIDESKEDKYELTRFVIENPTRFRNLTWRTFSNNYELVRGIIRAEKNLVDEFGIQITTATFGEIAKYVSRLGSVVLLDSLNETEIMNMVYDRFKI